MVMVREAEDTLVPTYPVRGTSRNHVPGLGWAEISTNPNGIAVDEV
jgi:hypothetical protein